ncbi:MAG: CoA-transferase subunit beta [Elusimicrobia bacterium]|nr:CoA-transferase subunit beta [Elusimicrobiota bacterium]
MCVLAAREIKDGDVVFVGIGLPNLACNLARATHAPNMTLIYESGAVGAIPDRVPPSIGDPALVTGSLQVASMADIFQCFLQNGKIEIGFLGGAQVDKLGRINTTVVGPYDAPKVRLPGSGGASEIAAHAKRVLIVTKLNKRAFPEAVDFVTSSGKRVAKVITNMGVLEPGPDGELELTALHRGVTYAQVQENVGWRLRRREPLSETPAPSAREIELLRVKLDPKRLHIK